MSIAFTNSAVGVDPQSDGTPPRWYNKLVGLLVAILCFEMGLFLLAFPWSPYWDLNFFSWFSPEWRLIWMNPYFRGAFSGLGVLNLALSLAEILRLQGKKPKAN